MLNTIQILIICATVFLIVVSICIAVCIYTRIEEGGLCSKKQLHDEYRRMQEQCNSMYKLYTEIKDDVAYVKKKLK